MSTKIVDEITPAQCRAARALLGLTQSELAKTARLGLSTIVDFERERRSVSAVAVKEMKGALERAGIKFIRQNGGGVGIRLREPQ